MSTVKAFNEMMEQFLNELLLTFPEEKKLRKYQAKFDLARAASPRSTLDAFMRGMGPHASMIMSKDEAIFKSDIPILKDLNLQKCWTDDLSQSTKDAMWQYVQTLYILGTTTTMFPPETLSLLETAAAKCASDMQDGGGGMLDESAISGMLSQMMSGMNKKSM
jgi:hypothetical protein